MEGNLICSRSFLAESWHKDMYFLFSQGTRGPTGKICVKVLKRPKVLSGVKSYVALAYRGHQPKIWDQISTPKMYKGPNRVARILSHSL